MNLIKLLDNTGWYWSVDFSGIGFYESKVYKTEKAAIKAGVNGNILWDTIDTSKQPTD